jgi:lipopolysaccharide export system protein LptA
MIRPVAFLVACTFLIGPAYAQDSSKVAPPAMAAPKAAPAASDGTVPLEIEADNALIWDRTKSQYIAEGNALAKQGDMQVTADKLTADYKDTNGRTEIWQITATGNVHLKSGASIANGDLLVYDVGTGKAVLTGNALSLTGEDGTKVTATERFEYWSADRKAIAIGNATLTSDKTTLEAPQITAWLADEGTKSPPAGASANPTGDIKKAETAGGPVTIKTETETVTAARGVYDGDKNMAYLYDNVVLNRPPHKLNGDRAEINLQTQVSQLFAAPGKDGKPGRVRGVFFPGKGGKL